MIARLALAALLASAALPARAGPAFVVNSLDASVSLIDPATRQELRRVPLLREPHHMALTPDHRSLLVGDTAGNALFFLDPETGAVQRHLAMSDPYQLVFSPDGRFLTVAGLARAQIDIYDATSFTLLHRVHAASLPSHINYAPDSRTVYVSLQGTDRLIAIDTGSGRVDWNARICRTPAGVLWLHGRLLVGCMGEADFAVVDPATGAVTRRIATGRGAHTMFLTHDGHTLYATNRVDGTLTVLDPETLATRRTIRVPGGPDDLDFAPDGRIWATLRFAHAVAVIDPATGGIDHVPAGRSPHGIWLNTHDDIGK